MTQGIEIVFNKLIHNNDINVVERIVYPIFSNKSSADRLFYQEIRSLFLNTMKNAKLSLFQRNIFWLYVNRSIKKGLKNDFPLNKVEEKLRRFVRRFASDEADKKPLSVQRAKMNFRNMKHYITGEKILDLGAGDGLMASEIKNQLGKDIILVDILDYNRTDLPLILYNPEGKIPLRDNEVDTTILYTVLHHSSDPKRLLEEATRVTKQRLIIKEAYVEDDIKKMINSFFDWFYNRVIGDEDIYVPLNFLKVAGWREILKSCGFDVIETKYVGIDEHIVPEYHVFIIAERVNKV